MAKTGILNNTTGNYFILLKQNANSYYIQFAKKDINYQQV
jgi:hypothetical protein